MVTNTRAIRILIYVTGGFGSLRGTFTVRRYIEVIIGITAPPKFIERIVLRLLFPNSGIIQLTPKKLTLLSVTNGSTETISFIGMLI